MGVCLWCGRISPLEGHHPTGDCDGIHWDPEYLIWLCASCHRAEHTAWRRAGIAELNDPLVARLTRNAWVTHRAGDLDRSFGPAELYGLNKSLNVCVRLVEGR
jgi:hypothetical protein